MLNSLDQAMTAFRDQAKLHNENIVKEIQSMSGILNDAKGSFEDAMRKQDLAQGQINEARDRALRNYIEGMKTITMQESGVASQRAKIVSQFDQVLMSIESAMIALTTMLDAGETVDGQITSSSTNQKQLGIQNSDNGHSDVG